MTERLTKALIAERVHERVGVSKKDAMSMLESILEEMKTSLEHGDDVKVSGFGHFALRDKKARVGRNPRTGEEALITPRRVVTFRPSRSVRNATAGDA